MFHEFWGDRGSRGGCRERHDRHRQAAGRRGPPWAGGGFGPRGGAPDWFGDWFGGPPPRAERGGVRYLVLDALAERARHGYEVIQAIEERSLRAYRPSPGVIYPTLQMLEELGHARVVEQESRKVYAITDEGRQDLELHTKEVSEFYDRLADQSWERHAEDFGELMRRAGRLFKVFKRAARRGHISARAQLKIRELLDDATQRIEQILDEDENR
jgi:DNA-binding PadR family transcriptional regulator